MVEVVEEVVKILEGGISLELSADFSEIARNHVPPIYLKKKFQCQKSIKFTDHMLLI